MTNNSDFEQKLADFKPRVLRSVTLQTPPRYFETKRPLSNHFRYIAVGIACFVLGAAAMYGLMRLPLQKERPPSNPPPGYVLMPMFSDTEIAKLQRPIDVLKLTGTQSPKPMVERQPERVPSLRTLQQEMLKNSH